MANFLYAVGFVISIIVFAVVTVIALYLSYIIAIGLVICLAIYAVYSVRRQMTEPVKTDPS